MELLWSGDLDWARQVRQDLQHQSTYNYTCVLKLWVLRTGRFKEAERNVGVLITVEASILLNANTPAGSWHRGLCLRPVMAETMKSHFHNRADWAVWLQQTPNGDVLWRWIMYITIASTSQLFAFFVLQNQNVHAYVRWLLKSWNCMKDRVKTCSQVHLLSHLRHQRCDILKQNANRMMVVSAAVVNTIK